MTQPIPMIRDHHVGKGSALLQIKELVKRYGDQWVLADISFSVQANEVLGLIGPNGAGKTTLMEAIAGLVPTDGGLVLWQGTALSLRQRRERLFYLPDGLHPWEDQFVSRVIEIGRASCRERV